ncbi:MAG: hypothetical protein ACLQOO_08550 [Terriglobia bacterium]
MTRMKTQVGRLVALNLLAVVGLAAPQQKPLAPALHEAAKEHLRAMQTSPLRQRAIAAGGELRDVHKANPANLAGDLPSLMQKSDEVLIVHILGNSCQVSPSGEDPITVYEGEVLRKYKGYTVGDRIAFSVPVGGVEFDPKTRASTAVEGFRPMLNGERYLLFLHFARGDERKLAAGLRLTGDGVQGAFKLEEEKVYAAYHEDSLWRKYRGVGVPQFLNDVESLAAAQRQAGAR